MALPSRFVSILPLSLRAGAAALQGTGLRDAMGKGLRAPSADVSSSKMWSPIVPPYSPIRAFSVGRSLGGKAPKNIKVVPSESIGTIIASYKDTGSTQGQLTTLFEGQTKGSRIAFSVTERTTRQRLVIMDVLKNLKTEPEEYLVVSSGSSPSIHANLIADRIVTAVTEDHKNILMDLIHLASAGRAEIEKDLDTPIPSGFTWKAEVRSPIQGAIKLDYVGINTIERVKNCVALKQYLEENGFVVTHVISAKVPGALPDPTTQDIMVHHSKNKIDEHLLSDKHHFLP